MNDTDNTRRDQRSRFGAYLLRLAGALEPIELLFANAEMEAELPVGKEAAPDLAKAIAELRLRVVSAVADFDRAVHQYFRGGR